MAIDQRLDWTGFESVEMILLLDLDQALQKPKAVTIPDILKIDLEIITDD